MLILASASPRRRQLLTTLGVEFDVRPADVDEGEPPGVGAERYVYDTAAAKAEAVAATASPDDLVIGSDTIVLAGLRALGKPRDRAEVEMTLRQMAGLTVEVLTAVSVAQGGDGGRIDRLSRSTCVIAELSEAELAAYLDSGVWEDKAGGLAVQHTDPAVITEVIGCRANVVGLPICDVAAVLRLAGVADVVAPACHPAGLTCVVDARTATVDPCS
ncbi:MAG: Maf family protein [Actinomycetota bacterium]|nr:Maf family protein [Actinomycetota bacterium]